MKLPTLIEIFVVDNDQLLACSCSLIDAKDIVVERSLLMDRKHIITNSKGEYQGHWAKGLLKIWVSGDE